jgi:hypothetical protein
MYYASTRNLRIDHTYIARDGVLARFASTATIVFNRPDRPSLCNGRTKLIFFS